MSAPRSRAWARRAWLVAAAGLAVACGSSAAPGPEASEADGGADAGAIVAAEGDATADAGSDVDASSDAGPGAECKLTPCSSWSDCRLGEGCLDLDTTTFQTYCFATTERGADCAEGTAAMPITCFGESGFYACTPTACRTDAQRPTRDQPGSKAARKCGW